MRMVMAGVALLSASLPMEIAMANAPMVVPGGQLDPAFMDADVFIGRPDVPQVPPGKACEVASRYVDLINAGDYAAVAALYANDATFLEPMRPTLHGRSQIDAFYNKQIGAMKPRIVAVSYLGGERECMVSLALRIQLDGQERYALVSADHFLVNEAGEITSMVAFARPLRSLPKDRPREAG